MLFGRRQTFADHVQIVVAVAKSNHQLGQGDQVFHLEAQRPSAPVAHLFQFRPLFFRHADVVLERFFGHARSLPDWIFELMRKCALQWDTLVSKSSRFRFPKVSQNVWTRFGNGAQDCFGDEPGQLR